MPKKPVNVPPKRIIPPIAEYGGTPAELAEALIAVQQMLDNPNHPGWRPTPRIKK